jgi:hypothetical protein
MKTKKYIIAIALFGGMLFAASATNLIDLNEQSSTEIERSKVFVPKHG